MAMAVSYLGDAPVYNLSAGKSLPQFFEEARKTCKSLRYDKEFRSRVELIQDFEFPASCQRVRVSRDGRYICATGGYPFEMKMYDTEDLGMKFCRRTDHEIVDFLFLGDDYKKLVFLQADRTLEFQTQFGLHQKVRVPKHCRTMAYSEDNAVLYVAGSSNQIFMIDLETGAFLQPLESPNLEEVNEMKIHPTLPLLALAGSMVSGCFFEDMVEFWDTRSMRADNDVPVSVLQVGEKDRNREKEKTSATCLDFSHSGMELVVGDSLGVARVYDIKSSEVVAERNNRNGVPLVNVEFQKGSSGQSGDDDEDMGLGASKVVVAAADAKSVKVWEYVKTGNNGQDFDNDDYEGQHEAFQPSSSSSSTKKTQLLAAIEADDKINQMTFYPNTGLLFAPKDAAQRIGIYFLPTIGIAPNWCSYLDNMTEELAETARKTVFDDYQFVTQEQVTQLAIDDLKGTKYLQPYMHGYFMDARMYHKLKEAMQLTNGPSYEERMEERKRKLLDEKAPMRVTLKKHEVERKKKGVNSNLFQKLSNRVDEAKGELASKKSKKIGDTASSVLNDPRFAAMFSNPDFEMEEV